MARSGRFIKASPNMGDVSGEMIGLDPNVADMLARCRLMFASEPNVNGRDRGVLAALEGGAN